MARPRRNTTRRDRHRRLVARDEPPCHICAGPIDFRLPHTDPWSFVIDHVTPLSRGGEDTLDNIRAAHRRCNESRGAPPPPGAAAWVTPRRWAVG